MIDSLRAQARRQDEYSGPAIETVLTRELGLAPDNVFVTVQPVELLDPRA